MDGSGPSLHMMRRWDIHESFRQQFRLLHLQRANVAVHMVSERISTLTYDVCDTYGSEKCLGGVSEKYHDERDIPRRVPICCCVHSDRFVRSPTRFHTWESLVLDCAGWDGHSSGHCVSGSSIRHHTNVPRNGMDARRDTSRECGVLRFFVYIGFCLENVKS